MQYHLSIGPDSEGLKIEIGILSYVESDLITSFR